MANSENKWKENLPSRIPTSCHTRLPLRRRLS